MNSDSVHYILQCLGRSVPGIQYIVTVYSDICLGRSVPGWGVHAALLRHGPAQPRTADQHYSGDQQYLISFTH